MGRGREEEPKGGPVGQGKGRAGSGCDGPACAFMERIDIGYGTRQQWLGVTVSLG